MGRGGHSQAVSAQGLLYGPRSRGSGPEDNRSTLTPFSEIVEALDRGQTPAALRRRGVELKFAGSAVKQTRDGCQATSVELMDITDNPLTISFLDYGERQAILIDYTRIDDYHEEPRPGSLREKALLRSLRDQLAGSNVDVLLSPEYPGQLEDIFASYYPPERFQFGSDSKQMPSQAELIEDAAQSEGLEEDEAAAIRRHQSLGDIYHDAEAFAALCEASCYEQLFFSCPLDSLPVEEN